MNNVWDQASSEIMDIVNYFDAYCTRKNIAENNVKFLNKLKREKRGRGEERKKVRKLSIL